MHSVDTPDPASPARQPAALVLGLDIHGLAVVRALADAGVAVYALERSLDLPGARSNRVRKVFVAADYSAEHLIPALQRVRAELAGHDAVALLAMNDRQVAVIAEHLQRLLPLYRIAWADRAELILKLQRKSELESISRQQGLNYPRSIVFDAPAVPSAADSLRYPVILKPVRPLSSFKTLLIDAPQDLPRALARYAGDLPILGQEYIAGGDEAIYFGALMLDRGRVVHGMVGRKIASHPPARGQTTIAETTDEPEVLRLTEQFFAGMGISGPVSLELKRAPDGSYWVIEPTAGRTDFWADLCIAAGFNQPLMEYQIALGLPVSAAGPLRDCVWYDTEREPLGWVRLALRERRWQPRQPVQVFPYAWRSDAIAHWLALKRLALSRLGRRS